MNIRTDITGGKLLNYQRINSDNVQETMKRLSTGLQINSASDDAAGLSISERLTSKIKENNMKIQNHKQVQSYYQTAEGVLSSISDHLQRLRELAVQGQNGTMSSTDVTALQNETNELLASIDNIEKTATFNGQKIFRENMLDDFKSSSWTHTGPYTSVVDANTLLISKPDMSNFGPYLHINKTLEPGKTYINEVEVENIDAVGVGAYIESWVYKSDGTFTWYGGDFKLDGNNSITFTAPDNATFMRTQVTMHRDTVGSFLLKNAQAYKLENVTENYAKEDVSIRQLGINEMDIRDQNTISKIDGALDLISEKRSAIGAKINSLDFRIQNETTSITNETQSRSRIKDTDFAKTSSTLLKSEITLQSNISMLQKNLQNQQSKLSLLQG